MATLNRSAKSGNDWTLNDLESYHISLDQEQPLLFFGVEELPQPSVDQELLSTADAGDMQQDRHAELVALLDLAMLPERGVDDFTVGLFRILGYVRRERVARTRVELPLYTCGETRHVKTDVCLVDRTQNDIVLLVQEDKRLESADPVNARAQLVAEAVAAFNENNVNREAVGLPPLQEKVILGIVMASTLPTFFKIPVTLSLATHIRHGSYPPDQTVVTYCYPPVPRPARRRTEGMKPLDNRREILKCYEAFKAIVGI